VAAPTGCAAGERWLVAAPTGCAAGERWLVAAPTGCAAKRDDGGVGALVTLELPADSPALSLPWIITIGPLSDDEEWEAVVCGPYERAHALALAEEVVADEDLMAVVEPVLPHVSVDAIREDVATARAQAAEEADDDADSDAEEEAAHREHAGPPTPEEIRAGFARIAARLTAD
jgi:hypothetical protein